MKLFLSGTPVNPLSEREEDGEEFLNIIRNNVTMEEFDWMSFERPRWMQEYRALLRLNRAGRKYILQDPTNHQENLFVLSVTRDDLNCLYLHLRENPSICNVK